MKLLVNGDPVELPDGSTVQTLLAKLALDGARVALERNEEVVPRQTWPRAALAEGDRIEIVNFVGGG